MDLIGFLLFVLFAGAALWLAWNLVLFVMGIRQGLRSTDRHRRPGAQLPVARPKSSEIVESDQSTAASKSDVPATDLGTGRDSGSTAEVNVALHGERRKRAFAEDVIVPLGAKVRTKRARTVVHALTMDWRSQKGVDIGIQHVLKSSVQKAIEQRHGGEIQRTETVEYEIELNGELAQHYRLIWTDVLLTGVSSLVACIA